MARESQQRCSAFDHIEQWVWREGEDGTLNYTTPVESKTTRPPIEPILPEHFTTEEPCSALVTEIWKLSSERMNAIEGQLTSKSSCTGSYLQYQLLSSASKWSNKCFADNWDCTRDVFVRSPLWCGMANTSIQRRSTSPLLTQEMMVEKGPDVLSATDRPTKFCLIRLIREQQHGMIIGSDKRLAGRSLTTRE